MNGFVHDLPEHEYHAHPGSLSVSGAKVLVDESPAVFRWQQDHPVHSDVFDIGSAAHKLALGDGPDIYVVPANDWRTKAAQTERDLARAEGLIPVLPATYEQVAAMAEKLREHRLAMRLLSAGEHEVSAFAPDDETGVVRRCRYDVLGERVAVDYKTTAGSVHPVALAGRYGTIRKYRYDRQAEWYLRLGRDLGHDLAAFAFIFQSKEPPYAVTVATVNDGELYDAAEKNRQALEIFRDCTESGLWPGALPDDTAAVVSLTSQTYYEELIA